MKKYILRSLKYFISYWVILTIVMSILVLVHAVDSNIESMFRNGYKSLEMIGLFFLVASIFHPRFGFTNKDVILPGETEQIKPQVIGYMTSRGYKQEKDNGDTMTFISSSKLSRIMKIFEDRITFTRTMSGYNIEGSTKELIRIKNGLEYKINPREDYQE